jgi:parallel beta-helix repeat protein
MVTDNFIGVLMISGTRALVEGVTATRNSGAGINLSSVVDGVVKRNEVFGNADGMGGGNVQNGLIERNSIHDNRFGGLGWAVINESRIVNNRIARNGTYGITLTDASFNNILRSNDVLRNGTDGIFIAEESSPNTLEDNRTDGNGDDGIDVDEPGSTLTRNHAFFNGDFGIEAVSGTIDGGKNKARHNGNPAQCTGVTCE